MEEDITEGRQMISEENSEHIEPEEANESGQVRQDKDYEQEDNQSAEIEEEDNESAEIEEEDNESVEIEEEDNQSAEIEEEDIIVEIEPAVNVREDIFIDADIDGDDEESSDDDSSR